MTSAARSPRRKATPAAAARTATGTAVKTRPAAGAADGSLLIAGAAPQQAFERLERLCAEGLRFATTRFEENRSTFQQLATSRHLPDQMAIWSRYVERTVKQYSDNLGTVAGICGAQATATLQDAVDAAPAGPVAVAEVSPSPLAEAIPPLPAAEPEPTPEPAPETAPEAALEPAPEPEAAAEPEVTAEAAASEPARQD